MYLKRYVGVRNQLGKYFHYIQVWSNTKARSHVNKQVQGTVVLNNRFARG